MQGALELAQSGIRSSLYPDNHDDPRVSAPMTPKAALMFDPQTSGGLLAVMPRDAAEALAKSNGIWIIGHVIEGSGVAFT